MVQSNRNSTSLSSSLQQASALTKANRASVSAFTPRVRAANSTLATATFLGTFPSSKKTVKDSVGQGNPADFFRVELTEASRIKLNFVNRSEVRLTAAILDANGKLITSSGRKQITVAAGKQGDTLVQGAQPGVYYVRVKGVASRTNRYDFNLFINRSGSPAPLPCGCGG